MKLVSYTFTGCSSCGTANTVDLWAPTKSDCLSSSPLIPYQRKKMRTSNPADRIYLCNDCRAHYEIYWLMAAHLSGKLLEAVNYTWANNEVKSVYLALMAKGA